MAPELSTDLEVVSAYIVCTKCKKGKLAESDMLNAGGPGFSEHHASHGIIAVTEAQFLEQYLAEGYVDVDRPSLQPIVTRFSGAPSKMTTVAPFGMPGSGSSGVNAQRRAMMGRSLGLKELVVWPTAERISLRPSWDETFLEVARVLSRRGTCSRKAVGAVLVKDTRIVATGYNGAPAGLPHCNHQATVGSDMENGHCAVAEHAERNALIYSGRESRGGTMYVTVAPCLTCLRMMVTAGVVRIVYGESYRPDRRVDELCAQAGIEIVHFKGSDPIFDPTLGVK